MTSFLAADWLFCVWLADCCYFRSHTTYASMHMPIAVWLASLCFRSVWGDANDLTASVLAAHTTQTIFAFDWKSYRISITLWCKVVEFRITFKDFLTIIKRNVPPSHRQSAATLLHSARLKCFGSQECPDDLGRQRRCEDKTTHFFASYTWFTCSWWECTLLYHSMKFRKLFAQYHG